MSFIFTIIRFSYFPSLRVTLAALAFVVCCASAQNTLAANFTVTRNDDRNQTCNSGTDCSLREAVKAANAAATNDVINFAAGLTLITLASGDTGDIEISNNGSLTLTGPGADILTIDGGAGINRIFFTNQAIVTISGVTLQGGNGAGVMNTGSGGAIYVFKGKLTLNGVTVQNNGGAAVLGGGIYHNFGTDSSIINSTFSGNSSTQCGAFANISGTLVVMNTTISGNTASFSGNGGGGGFCNTGGMTMRNSTVANNSATAAAGSGGGTYNFGSLFIGNTIIAGNTASAQPEIRSETSVTSSGNNLIGDSAGDSTDTFTSITYKTAAGEADILNTPPLLGALQNNGGRTATRALLAGSPAIDKGRNDLAFNVLSNSALATDQRGFARIADGDGNGAATVDIGAFEAQQQAPGAHSISGTVFYGTTPAGNPPKYVSGVTLNAAGMPAASTTTAINGNYALSGLGSGMYTVTPSRAAQNDNNGISLQDASEAAKIAFNQNPNATNNQRTAADATGNGTVSLQDASEIAKRVFNTPSTNVVGQWKFVSPMKNYPNIGANLTGENYDAILVGDVTGNWTPPANRPAEEAVEEKSQADETNPAETVAEAETGETHSEFGEQQSGIFNTANESSEQETSANAGGVPLSLPNVSGNAGATVLIPVTVGNLTGENVTAYDFTVSFDPNILQPASPAFETAGALTGATGGYTVFVDPMQPTGRVRIGTFGTTPLSGQGTLIFLRFNVVNGGAAASPLNFEQFIFGEGAPQDAATNGSFMRLGPTAASVTVGGRVQTANGRAIRNVRVTMTSASGEIRTALSTSFGYFRFTNVPAGEAYIFSVAAKRFQFSQPTLAQTILEDKTDLDFVAVEN